MSLEIISRLHDHDRQILDLALQIRKERIRVKELTGATQKATESLGDAEKKQKEGELNLRNLELKLKEFEGEKKKLEQQKMAATSEKMLEAVQGRLDSLIQNMETVEEEWFMATEEHEALVETVSRLGDVGAEDRRKAEDEIDKINGLLVDRQKELAQLVEDRPTFMDGLESAVLQHYERLRAQDPYRVVVGAVESQICPICSMQIASKDYSRIRYDLEVKNCPDCGSILFWNQEQDA